MSQLELSWNIIQIKLIYLSIINFLSILFQIKEQKLREKLKERCKFPLEDKLRQHLVGQEGPITAVAAGMSLKT